MPAAEFTKEFVTSVVVGKDVVPRLGLHQLETLRSSLVTAINKSTDPKWKILGSSMLCCGGGRKETASKMSASPVVSIEDGAGSKDVPSTATTMTKHPSDTNVSLSTHQPLYPPGRIIHIVRQHPKTSDRYKARHTIADSSDTLFLADDFFCLKTDWEKEGLQVVARF